VGERSIGTILIDHSSECTVEKRARSACPEGEKYFLLLFEFVHFSGKERRFVPFGKGDAAFFAAGGAENAETPCGPAS